MKGLKDLDSKGIDGLEMLTQIKKACMDNNHKSVRQGLDKIESDELKRKAFLKIIDYYENEQTSFPVGYVILFIEWLLKKRDFDGAADNIEKLKQVGIARDRISELVYEHLIKPNEKEYEERFKRNLDLLKENGILFSHETLDFECIKKNITTIKSVSTHPEGFIKAVSLEKVSYLFVDMADMSLIQKILDAGNLLYLVYDDISRFYYMLIL